MASPELYEQQKETGKDILREILRRLATDLNQPQIIDFKVVSVDQDISNEQVSILGPNLKIVTKVGVHHLADLQDDATARRKLEHQLNAAVRAYYKSKL